MSKATSDARETVERGSGNVFADLDLPNPDLALAKAELVQRIRHIIEERGLTQAKAAQSAGDVAEDRTSTVRPQLLCNGI